jgi:uncharacterized damage-inducible protein DinB
MEATSEAKTLLAEMPWIKTLLDYTDAVCQGLPEDADALRPVDPAGGFVFSAKELAAHIADERWSLCQAVTGEDHSANCFAGDYPGKDKPWLFRAATNGEILASLAAGRAKVDELLRLGAVAWHETTPGLVKQHAQRIAKLRAEGKDTAALEAKGPSTLGNILLFLVAHETGHRSVLQHLLRMHGVNVARFA